MNIKLTIKIKIQDVEHEFTVEELGELRDTIGDLLGDYVVKPKEFTPQELKDMRTWPKRTPAQEWADLKNQIRLSPLPNIPTDIEVTEAINNR